MAKENQESQKKNKVSEQQVKNVINALRNDLIGITGFISKEFIQVAVGNNGEIDANQQNFKTAAHSLIHADPDGEENKGRPVLSFTATEKGINEKIQNLIKDGADPKLFEGLQKEMKDLKDNLSQKVSSTEGIKELISERLKERLVGESMSFWEKDEQGNPKSIPMQTKKDLSIQLKDKITLSDEVIKNMLVGGKEYDKKIKTVAANIIHETFSVEGNNKTKNYTLDKSKLNDKNLENFSEKISSSINDLPAVSLIEESIKSMMQQKKSVVNNARVKKITDLLMPALSKLGPEYLKEHGKAIQAEIVKSLYDNKTFASKFTKDFTISTQELQKIAEQIGKKHQEKSNKPHQEKIEQTIRNKSLTNSKLAEGLSEFTGKRIDSKNLPSNKKLIEMRKNDPKKFDELVLGDKDKKIEKEVEKKENLKPMQQVSTKETKKDSQTTKQQESIKPLTSVDNVLSRKYATKDIEVKKSAKKLPTSTINRKIVEPLKITTIVKMSAMDPKKRDELIHGVREIGSKLDKNTKPKEAKIGPIQKSSGRKAEGHSF